MYKPITNFGKPPEKAALICKRNDIATMTIQYTYPN